MVGKVEKVEKVEKAEKAPVGGVRSFSFLLLYLRLDLAFGITRGARRW